MNPIDFLDKFVNGAATQQAVAQTEVELNRKKGCSKGEKGEEGGESKQRSVDPIVVVGHSFKRGAVGRVLCVGGPISLPCYNIQLSERNALLPHTPSTPFFF